MLVNILLHEQQYKKKPSVASAQKITRELPNCKTSISFKDLANKSIVINPAL